MNDFPLELQCFPCQTTYIFGIPDRIQWTRQIGMRLPKGLQAASFTHTKDSLKRNITQQ